MKDGLSAKPIAKRGNWVFESLRGGSLKEFLGGVILRQTSD